MAKTIAKFELKKSQFQNILLLIHKNTPAIPFVKRILLQTDFKNRIFHKIDEAAFFFMTCIDGFLFEPFGN